ncbi:LAMI_0H04830g1_1 [Lachancea mirantina]|uniref:LAMI_0H04830g1_1 n=1 Tax=Lachancea mirantina TaxID=1230905 RepID=A0A1G4KEP1_9SACH|nr:LAMI_0H04830g1_1 [Lachancea mirantina]
MLNAKELRELHFKIPTGYGLMGHTWRSEPTRKEQSFKAIDEAVELSGEIGLYNIGEFYGPEFSNLHLARDYLKARPQNRSKMIFNCKGSIDVPSLKPKGSYADVTKSIETCVEHFGGPIDIYEVARIDAELAGDKLYPRETFDAMVDAIKRGLIGGISLSEVTAEQIRAIHADYGQYLCSVEIEVSLFSRDNIFNGVLDACNELGLPVLCYSPLGRGLLTGNIAGLKDIPEGDFRLRLKRFQGDSMNSNLLLVEFLKREIVAKSKTGITLPQVALGWVRSLNEKYTGTHLLPIPGGSTAARVSENMALKKLSPEELSKINEFLSGFTTVGGRYEMAE